MTEDEEDGHGDPSSLAAANLLTACLQHGPGAWVNPNALPGWIFTIAPNGRPIAIRLRPTNPTATLALQ